jgi:hypothetical protein
MTGMSHHAKPLVEMGSCGHFVPAGLMILLISAFWVTSTTGLSHHA